jgi:transcription antitermination factor NusG
MTATPLWLALKISPGKERKAHQLFEARGIVSVYAHKIVKRRVSRHAKKETTYEVPLLAGYALVAHPGSPVFTDQLQRLCWAEDERRYEVIRNEIGSIVGLAQSRFEAVAPRFVVRDIVGQVRADDIDRLRSISGQLDSGPQPNRLTPGQIATICSGPLEGRQVKITVVRGNKVRVELDGRELLTTVEKLEAA